MSIAELVRDRYDSTVYRVEAIDDDGGCEVTIFSGVLALLRAIHHIKSDWYDGFSDPQNLIGS